jgi:dUTP pyrophosphatase
VPVLSVYPTGPDSKMPTQSTTRAQCIDFYAAEDAVIDPGQTVLVDLGVKVVLPEGYGLEFRERSGLAVKGIIIGGGIIDEDYHGTLKAIVRYMTSIPPVTGAAVPEFNPVIVKAGDKIVQAELVKRIPIEIRCINEGALQRAIDHSQRGEKGFGSTDENPES